jgi:hypothetical protein
VVSLQLSCSLGLLEVVGSTSFSVDISKGPRGLAIAGNLSGVTLSGIFPMVLGVSGGNEFIIPNGRSSFSLLRSVPSPGVLRGQGLSHPMSTLS